MAAVENLAGLYESHVDFLHGDSDASCDSHHLNLSNASLNRRVQNSQTSLVEKT